MSALKKAGKTFELVVNEIYRKHCLPCMEIALQFFQAELKIATIPKHGLAKSWSGQFWSFFNSFTFKRDQNCLDYDLAVWREGQGILQSRKSCHKREKLIFSCVYKRKLRILPSVSKSSQTNASEVDKYNMKTEGLPVLLVSANRYSEIYRPFRYMEVWYRCFCYLLFPFAYLPSLPFPEDQEKYKIV